MKNLYSKLKPFLPNIAIFLAIVTLSISSVAYAQFARQTGSVGWGYGYGWGYGLGHGWDGGEDAGRRIVGQPDWTVYTEENSDLGSDNIFLAAADPNSSNVWVILRDELTGNTAGLQKFDGSTWVTYNTGNSDIPTNNISYVVVDNNGDIWLGGEDESLGESLGLIHFDVSEDTWTTYNTGNSDIPINSIGAGSAVFSIDVDSTNNIWVNTGKYIYSFNPETEAVAVYDGSYLGTDPVLSSVLVDVNDNVWVGARTIEIVGKEIVTESKLLRFDGSTWTVYTTENSDMEPYGAMPVDYDSEGGVWFIYQAFSLAWQGGPALQVDSPGLGYFDGDSTWEHYTPDNSELAYGNTYGGYVDSYGQVWVTSYELDETTGESSIGFQFLDHDAGIWSNIDLPEGFAFPFVFSETSDGKLWGFGGGKSDAGIFSLSQQAPGSQFAYGYGHGYMPEKSDNVSEIAWNAESGRYDVSGASYTDLSIAGVVVPIGSDSFSEASALKYLFDTKLTFDEGSSVYAEGDTTFTIASQPDESTTYEFSADLSPIELAGLSEDVLASLKFGFSNMDLTSDKPVTISFNVGSIYDGQTLNVYHKSPTESSWSLLTTCIVSSGVCDFTTTSFSSFAVTTPTTTETSNGGGGSGFPEHPGGNPESLQDEPVDQTEEPAVTPGQENVENESASSCASASYYYTRKLQYGSVGSDVQQLQKVLNNNGFTISASGQGSPGNESTYFGQATEDAVKTLQTYYGQTADGVVGSKTGVIIEALSGCKEVLVESNFVEESTEDFEDQQDRDPIESNYQEDFFVFDTEFENVQTLQEEDLVGVIPQSEESNPVNSNKRYFIYGLIVGTIVFFMILCFKKKEN